MKRENKTKKNPKKETGGRQNKIKQDRRGKKEMKKDREKEIGYQKKE